MLFAKLALFGSAVFIIYTYIVYPLLVALLGGIIRRRIRPLNGSEKKVSVIMAVYNGEAWLESKLASLREQSYPQDLIEIIAVSDGSDDGTDALLEAQADVRFHRLPQRSGKPTALNQAAALATGDIYVFTDARQRLSKDAISALVTALGDPAVGVASGELVMHANSNTESRSVGLYWHYEKWIRSNEARVHSIPGATGALYAIANDDYASIPADTLLDDFDIPINVLRRKKRIVMVPEAIAYDHAVEEISKERIRKVRTLTGNFQSFARHPWLFNPFMNPIFWQFISHKVFRLLVPYALFVLLIGSIVLREWWATLLQKWEEQAA